MTAQNQLKFREQAVLIVCSWEGKNFDQENTFGPRPFKYVLLRGLEQTVIIS